MTTTHRSSCEEFEIAALRRSRGAIDAGMVERLQAHLGSCTGCHGFAATAEATEAALRGRVRAASDGRDWDRVRAGFRARRRVDRNRKLRGLASFAVMVAIAWSVGGPITGAAFAVLFALIGALLYRWFLVPEQRRWRDVESIDTEMLAFYRSDLDKEIAGLRGGRPLLVVFGLLLAMNALLMAGHIVKEILLGNGLPRLETYLATFVTFAALGGVFWLRARLLLPRLERERRELGP